MLSLLITFLVFLIVFGLAWWVVNEVGLPAPLDRIARIIIVVIGAIVLIYMLLGLAGHVGAGPVLLR